MGSYNYIKDTINSYQLTINYVSVTLNRNASDVGRLKIAFNFVVGCLMCAEGWVMDTEAGCLDIDECFSGSSPCKENEFCVNNEGSYTCLGKYTRPFPTNWKVPFSKIMNDSQSEFKTVNWHIELYIMYFRGKSMIT